MAQRTRPDRCPHEALPRRRRLWYGIESEAARRLSSGLLYNSVDHAFQKLSTSPGEMMIPAVFVGANRPRTLNIPRPGIDFRLRGRRLSWPADICFFFVSNTFGQSKILIPLDYIPFTYNICNSFRFGVRSRCSPHAHHDTSSDGSQLVSLILSWFSLLHCFTPFLLQATKPPPKG